MSHEKIPCYIYVQRLSGEIVCYTKSICELTLIV